MIVFAFSSLISSQAAIPSKPPHRFSYSSVSADSSFPLIYASASRSFSFRRPSSDSLEHSFSYFCFARRFSFRFISGELRKFSFSYYCKSLSFRFCFPCKGTRGRFRFRYDFFANLYYEDILRSFMYPLRETLSECRFFAFAFFPHELFNSQTIFEFMHPLHSLIILPSHFRFFSNRSAFRHPSLFALAPPDRAALPDCAHLHLSHFPHELLRPRLDYAAFYPVREVLCSASPPLFSSPLRELFGDSYDIILSLKFLKEVLDLSSELFFIKPLSELAAFCADIRIGTGSARGAEILTDGAFSMFMRNTLELYSESIGRAFAFPVHDIFMSAPELQFYRTLKELINASSDMTLSPELLKDAFYASLELFLSRTRKEALFSSLLSGAKKNDHRDAECLGDHSRFSTDTRELYQELPDSGFISSVRELFNFVVEQRFFRTAKEFLKNPAEKLFLLNRLRESFNERSLFGFRKRAKEAAHSYAEPKVEETNKHGLFEYLASFLRRLDFAKPIEDDFAFNAFDADDIDAALVPLLSTLNKSRVLNATGEPAPLPASPKSRVALHDTPDNMLAFLAEAFKSRDFLLSPPELAALAEMSSLLRVDSPELFFCPCFFAARLAGSVDLHNERELALWQRFWFLAAEGETDPLILPCHDFPYQDKPIVFEGFDDLIPENRNVVFPSSFFRSVDRHPIPDGADLGRSEFPLALNIMVDIINILILMWHRFYPAFWGWTGTQAVLGITAEALAWLSLESSRAAQDEKGSRKHYDRCYQWLRWEAEKVVLGARNDMELRGNFYVALLLEELIAYMLDHHFDVMPIFEHVNKMDEWRTLFGSDLQRDISWVLDKVKGIRHKLLFGKEKKFNA